jgi:hypothetical protein
MPKSVKKSLKKYVKFNELPPKHQKRKRKSIAEMDDEEMDEYDEKKEFDRNYKKQFEENRKQVGYQNYVLKEKEMSPTTWDDLDNIHGPTKKYVYPLELQTGPEIEANFNALTNRGMEIPEGKRRILAVWGGRKSRKGRKNNKRKSKKNRH